MLAQHAIRTLEKRVCARREIVNRGIDFFGSMENRVGGSAETETLLSVMSGANLAKVDAAKTAGIRLAG